MSHTIRIFSLSYTFSITKYWKKEKRKFSLKAQSIWYYLTDFFPYISAYDVPYIHVHMVFLVKPSHRHLTLYIFLIIKNTYRLPNNTDLCIISEWEYIFWFTMRKINITSCVCEPNPSLRLQKQIITRIDMTIYLSIFFFIYQCLHLFNVLPLTNLISFKKMNNE